MKELKTTSREYAELLKARAGTSRAYHSHQLIGLEIAVLLRDMGHKSLYIKLVKEHGAERLLELATSIAQNPRVTNRGAYFMKVMNSK